MALSPKLKRFLQLVVLLLAVAYYLYIEWQQASLAEAVRAGALSAAQAERIADDIAYGHAYQKHVIDQYEFGHIISKDDFSDMIEHTLSEPDDSKVLDSDSAAFWDNDMQLLVIYNPYARDKGTAYRPYKGKRHFYEID